MKSPAAAEFARRIREPLRALEMIAHAPLDAPSEAKQLQSVLEVRAHADLIRIIEDLANTAGSSRMRAFADEYRALLSTIWSAKADEEKPFEWGLFNPTEANKHRRAVIDRVSLVVRQLEDTIFEQPLTSQLLLFDNLFAIFEAEGFLRCELPLINEQYGTPPALRALSTNSTDSEPHLPEVISIDGLLGAYTATHQQITLFADGIRWCAAELSLHEAELRLVVLAHEFAHWLVHSLPAKDAAVFPLDQYEKTEEQLHEMLAQLLTFWLCQRTAPSFEAAFDKLNKRQGPLYTEYRRFKDIDRGAIIKAIIKARQRGIPSTLADFENDLCGLAVTESAHAATAHAVRLCQRCNARSGKLEQRMSPPMRVVEVCLCEECSASIVY